VAFRLAAIFVAILPFIVAEAGLRLFGVGRPEESVDALSGFNQALPLFVRQGPVYRTAKAREPYFNQQEFAATKPPKGFRAFCFGGSTVFGHPYEGETSFCKWLELELSAADPARSYEVINGGGVSYARYRLVPLVKEVLHYQPDLVILATGHNEFLEDRTYQAIKTRSALRAKLENAACSLRLLNFARQWVGRGKTDHKVELSPEVEPKLDTASGYASYHRDDAWRERVIAQFAESVRTMVSDCRAAGVPVILVKLGANLRDCPPFKSEHRPGLSADQERVWQETFEAGAAAELTNAPAALGFYRKAEAIDAEYALLDYRIARTLDRVGRKPEALHYYSSSKEQDVCPLRILAPFQEILTRVAAEAGAPLVDAEALIAAEAPDSIPGFDWYLDHVHPNIGGHQRIARALAEQVWRSGLSPDTCPWTVEQRRQAYAQHLQRLGPRYFLDGRRRVVWLDSWARRQRLSAEALPRDAEGQARLGFRCLDLGDEEGTREALDKALQADQAALGLIRARARELESEGRAQAAASLLQNRTNADARRPLWQGDSRHRSS
jgi:lysophospholipase L1-like esterase